MATSVRPPSYTLTGYFRALLPRALAYLSDIHEAQLPEIVESTRRYVDELAHKRASIEPQEVMLARLCEKFMPDESCPHIKDNVVLSVGENKDTFLSRVKGLKCEYVGLDVRKEMESKSQGCTGSVSFVDFSIYLRLATLLPAVGIGNKGSPDRRLSLTVGSSNRRQYVQGTNGKGRRRPTASDYNNRALGGELGQFSMTNFP
ncbi:hypothetical protein M9H77_26881 [Catharanthus roseus]|uniref:Uncharacterized protein n=1 Tax=Catharanthus roseus TaxID=4058 RepID=A0ACC0AF74_CATRO|nr:hypothetical protein M9H77_26881 [Catharanthus roseus]